jgi:alkanesulfonate monooxygenase SsuD/methylene tetrahydromethanopterin reductase-like flavin-dependent oxidoreductase (luciferase family)
LARAGQAERAGWDGVRIGRGDEPSAGGTWAIVAALAAAVPRLQLQVRARVDDDGHPAVLAKLATTADQLSDGRLLLGLSSDDEARLAEACEVVQRLTSTERSLFEGHYYRLHDAPLDPKPTQQPFPLMLADCSATLAAARADHWSISTTGLEAQLTALDEACAAAGRDRATISVSAVGDEASSPTGVDEWVVTDDALGADWAASLARIGAAQG